MSRAWPLLLVAAALLLAQPGRAGEIEGEWLGEMRRDFGPRCENRYRLHIVISGEDAAGQIIGRSERIELLGAVAEDGRKVTLRGKAALRFQLDGQFDGQLREDRLLGTWSAIYSSLGDCSGSFMMLRKPEE